MAAITEKSKSLSASCFWFSKRGQKGSRKSSLLVGMGGVVGCELVTQSECSHVIRIGGWVGLAVTLICYDDPQNFLLTA